MSFWNRSLTGFQFTVQFWRIWWANTRTIRFSPVLSRSSWIKVENKYFSDNLQILYLIICIISIIVNHEMCSKLFILSLSVHIFLNYFLLFLNQLLVKLVSFYETKIHTNELHYYIISFWTEKNMHGESDVEVWCVDMRLPWRPLDTCSQLSIFVFYNLLLKQVTENYYDINIFRKFRWMHFLVKINIKCIFCP